MSLQQVVTKTLSMIYYHLRSERYFNLKLLITGTQAQIMHP